MLAAKAQWKADNVAALLLSSTTAKLLRREMKMVDNSATPMAAEAWRCVEKIADARPVSGFAT